MICEKDNLGLKDIIWYLSNAFSKYSDFVILRKFCAGLIRLLVQFFQCKPLRFVSLRSICIFTYAYLNSIHKVAGHPRA